MPEPGPYGPGFFMFSTDVSANSGIYRYCTLIRSSASLLFFTLLCFTMTIGVPYDHNERYSVFKPPLSISTGLNMMMNQNDGLTHYFRLCFQRRWLQSQISGWAIISFSSLRVCSSEISPSAVFFGSITRYSVFTV